MDRIAVDTYKCEDAIQHEGVDYQNDAFAVFMNTNAEDSSMENKT